MPVLNTTAAGKGVSVATLEDVTRSIAGNVRSERTMRGWTLDELAERSGVSR
jgi:hypothetical protein